MKDEPRLNKSKLLNRKRACQKLAVYTNRRLILTVVHVNMRLVVLLVIQVEQLDNESIESAELRHANSLLSHIASV